MTTPTIVTGDDFIVPVQLYKNDLTFAIGGAAVVKARLVSQNHETPLTDEETQSSATSGATWGTSLVVVTLASGLTAGVVPQGDALLEIQVNDSGKLTWFIPVIIVKGHVA